MSGAILRFAKLSQNAMAPTKGSKAAAGYDLYRYSRVLTKLLANSIILHVCKLNFSAYDYIIPAMGKIVAKTDIQIALPDGCYGRVAPRSGLAATHHIDIGGISVYVRCNIFLPFINFLCISQLELLTGIIEETLEL